MADQISLGKNGNIGKIDFSRIKAGVKKEELVKNDARLESVFDIVDKNKDGVLDREELNDLQNKLGESAGDDGVLEKKEVKNFGEYKLGRKDRKALLEFLNKLDGVTPEDVEKVETKLVDDKQVEVVTYKDGHTEEYYPNGQKISEFVQGNKKTKTTEMNGEITSEVVTENEGEENEIISTTSIVDGKKQTIINNKGDKTTTTINYNGDKKSDATVVGENSKTDITYDSEGNPAKEIETTGTTEKTYIYQKGQKVLQSAIENKGLEGKETTKVYDSEGGYTQTQNVPDGKITKVVDKEGGYIETREMSNGKITTVVDKEGNVTSNVKTETVNGQEVSLQLDKDGNIPGVIVQNGESPAAIAKKFGCSVDELMQINAGKLKGKGKNKYFEVGSEIKLPNTVGIEKFSKVQKGRKPAEVVKAEYQRDLQIRAEREAQMRAQAQAQQRAQAAANQRLDRDLRTNYGLRNYSGRGGKITGKYANGKTETFTIIGKAKFERTVVQDKKGNIHVIANGGVILKDTYAINTSRYESVLVGNTRVAITGNRRDGHGRRIGLDANGRQIVLSHDNKILKNDYVAASDNYDAHKKTQRTQTGGVGYGKAPNGQVYYFDDNNQGKAIIGQRRTEVVKKDAEYITNELYGAAKGMGTDEERLENGIRQIYSREMLQQVNAQLRTKDSDYAGDAQTMPVEALILDEMSHTAARPLFKTLMNSGTMTTKEKAHTVKREIEYEVHGGLTGHTSTSNLNEIMQLCTDRDVRLEVEAQFKKDHPELAENNGSVVRSYIAGDGWNAKEVDQFDANWVKTGAYQEARYVYQTDENGNVVLDKNGQPVVVLDKGDQEHRNGVIGRLVFDYQDKEALNKGLDALNENPSSFDYQYLDKRAGQEIAKDPQGKYQSRFTNQDNVQRYLAGFHSDAQGNVDAGNVSASNTCLFKGIKPARVQAEEALYNAKNGDYSQTFDSMDSETYSAMAELVANGDVKGVKNMTDLYNKALSSATDLNDKTKIKANAMLSGQVNFTNEQIADFCVELMHSIDANRGRGASTGMSAGYTNDADYQTEQLKAILQNNPQVMDAVKARVEKENFSYTTTISSGGEMPTTSTFKTNTKDTYIQLLSDTKTIGSDEIFYDADGNKITDPQQIQQIKNANMQSLEQMRQYVAELERDYKKGIDAEGLLSDAANGLSRYSGLGTDRDDVATEYRNAKLMLQQFEAAAQGKLRDSKGNVISAQDLAQQMMDKQNALAKTNSDYKQTITYGKMGIVLAPVIVATTVVSGGTAAAGWGTLGVAGAGGTAAAATTYGVNALEYNTSYTGNTAEAREQNLEDSLVNGATTAIGIGQMKYISGMANNMGTVARTGIRLSTTIGADTGVGAAAEYATTGDVSAQGTMTNMIMSGVGNTIGARTLGKKQPAPNMHPSEGVYLTQDAPVAGRNEITDAQTARNIDQSHLNSRDRQVIAKEMEAQGTPTQAELDIYAQEHAYQAPSVEEKAALDAHQKQVRSDYSEAHRIGNNATITKQKTSASPLSAEETVIKNLENEVGALDGQIKRLNQQLEGAKRANQMGRKNDGTIKKLKEQIESLRQKRTAKVAELETARKPVEVKADEVTSEAKPVEVKADEVKSEAKPVEVKSEAKPNEEVPVTSRATEEVPKVEVKTETVINDVNSINVSEIPSQHQKLWQNCKERIEKLVQELSMPNINTKELITRGKELLANLKTIANSAAGALKAKIENLYNDIRVMLNNAKKQIQNTYFNNLSAKQKESVYALREIYHSDLDDVATLRMDYPQYSYMSDKELLDFFKLDEKHAAFVKNRKDLFANGDAKYIERAYWNDSPYELTNNHSAWKMHLYSVDELDYQSMAEVVLPYLNKHKIAHKTLSSTMSPELLAKTAPKQTGKAFTIYPQSQEEMAQIAKDLDKLIREHNLTTNTSHITGDNQLGDSGRLFYRYEYKTGKLKDRIYTPGENSLMHAAYDSNRGEGQYLAHDMTPADDPWLNFDPSNPQSVPGQNFSQAKEVPINEMRQPTSQERIEMGQISNSINYAKTSDDIAKAQQWLDTMPECPQKSRLQAQLNEKVNTINTESLDAVAYIDFTEAKAGTVFPKNQGVVVSADTKLNLANQCEIDFNSPAMKSKLKTMKDGDVLIVGREPGAYGIVISDRFTGVSRKHLKIEKFGDQFIVTDISTNGTILNPSTKDSVKITNDPVARRQENHRIAENLNTNELAREFGNGGRPMDSNYVKNSKECREYLLNSIDDGIYTQSVENYMETMNEAHRISHSGVDRQHAYYERLHPNQYPDGCRIDAGVIKNNSYSPVNGRYREAKALEPFANAHGDSFRVGEDSYVELPGISRKNLPHNGIHNYNGRPTWGHRYPSGTAQKEYFTQMHRTAQEAMDLIKQGASEQAILSKLAEHYQYAANARPYDNINNSLFMNELNTLLNKAGLKTIPHGDLDFAAMYLQPKTFQKYFIEHYNNNSI